MKEERSSHETCSLLLTSSSLAWLAGLDFERGQREAIEKHSPSHSLKFPPSARRHVIGQSDKPSSQEIKATCSRQAWLEWDHLFHFDSLSYNSSAISVMFPLIVFIFLPFLSATVPTGHLTSLNICVKHLNLSSAVHLRNHSAKFDDSENSVGKFNFAFLLVLSFHIKHFHDLLIIHLFV